MQFRDVQPDSPNHLSRTTGKALFLLIFNLSCLLSFSSPGIGQRSPDGSRTFRPNIVFILIDDLRWDELSIVGHPYIKTPNIDRIGKEGALFRNAFLTTPLCSPSRASFLTGQYAHTHGITGKSIKREFE
jgi:N-acetylglucosamine-6-sulfatase